VARGWRERSCPTCKAWPGEPCRTPSGRAASQVHTARLRPGRAECTDLQGLRELTVNAIEAIAALGPGAGGRVVCDLDWELFESSGGRIRKLSAIDTRTGMTAAQRRHYSNQLAASGRERSLTGNFGVGAKVAAGSR
jgi:hypothetical protein